MFSSIRRILSLAVKDIFRNWWLSFVTITVVFLALVSVNTLFVWSLVSEHISTAVESKVNASVSLYPTASTDAVSLLRQYITSLPDVETVEQVTPDEAKQRFRDRHEYDTDLLDALDALDENPFGSSLVITARSIDAYEDIFDRIVGSPYQDIILDKSFGDHQSVIERIQSITQAAKRAGYMTSIIFILIATLIVVNTIRMTIYTHRDEIGIMKRVGATNRYARMPFVCMSGIYGIVGFALATGVFFVALRIGQPYLNVFFAGLSLDLNVYFINNVLRIFGVELFCVLFLTTLSSFLATRRYLRV